MPPLSLSDEELSLLRSLAEPVAYGQRREFCRRSRRPWRPARNPDPARRTALRAMFSVASSSRRSESRPSAKRRGSGGPRTALKPDGSA
jgi:hypothetical protein